MARTGELQASPSAADGERVPDRLLRSTAARGYDPDVDIDWSAPLDDAKGYVLAHRCSLYGTALWDALTPQQRIELGKHEAASVAGAGIWLEAVLMQMLARLAYHGDPLSRRIQYALTELGEETRHTTMLARMIERLGTPCYGPPRLVRLLGSLLAATASGPGMWGAILIGEEIVDRLQRELVPDESIQPLVRMVSRIHIIEEARHVGFARTELTASVGRTGPLALRYHRMVLARTGFVVSRILISPQVYRAVGLDPRQARKAALANPYHREALRYGGEKVVAFLAEAGLIGHPGVGLWRRSFLLG